MSHCLRCWLLLKRNKKMCKAGLPGLTLFTRLTPDRMICTTVRMRASPGAITSPQS